MKTDFAVSWKSSIDPAKQRKYRYNAPLHIRQKFVSANCSPELRKKYQKRSLPVHKGDKVKVVRGQYRGKTGRVDRVSLAHSKVYIEGITVTKKEGTPMPISFEPSNLMLIEIKMDDKKRIKNETKKSS
jgi:large subunit ribosomal protein L24